MWLPYALHGHLGCTGVITRYYDNTWTLNLLIDKYSFARLFSGTLSDQMILRSLDKSDH